MDSSSVVLASLAVPEEDGEFGLQANLDGSVAWQEVDDDELLDEQFVDFIREEGDCVLDLIQEVYEKDDAVGEIDSVGNENALCNGVVKRKTTYGGPKNNRRYNVAQRLGFKCGVCLLRFTHRTHLIRHLLLKHRQEEDDENKAERIYSRCQRCVKTFQKMAELAEHLRQFHKETFLCGNCLRMFKDKKTLNRHRKLHAGMNPYVCDVCDKECSNQSHLLFHRRTHFVETDLGYRCPHCNQAFSSSGNCQKHIARVHTFEKRHKCPQCPQKFLYSRQLNAHKKQTHTSPTLCQDCNTHFKSPKQLAKHREKHHQPIDRPYACDQCSSRFKQSSHLHIHKKTHSEDRPIGCNICQKKFLTGSDLRRHERTLQHRSKLRPEG